MSEICGKCGLPTEICACELIKREETTKINVYATKKKFGKLVTVVEGIEEKDMDKLAKELKRKLACGGSTKEGMILLQGDHLSRIKQHLVNAGYVPEHIIFSSRR